MSKIIQLTAENVKRLHAVDITPQGNVVEITGKNGQGKSSVLDAIAMALGGGAEMPTLPIRKGEAKAKIVLDLGDLKVTRTVTESGSTLIVETPEGARFQSPQTILDKLTGKITFDPLAFIRLKRDEQGKILRDLVGLDFTQADYDRRQLYDARTQANKVLAKAKAHAESLPHYADAPGVEPDTSALVDEITEANNRNEAYDSEAEKIRALKDDLSATSEEIDTGLLEIEALTKQIAEINAAISRLEIEKRSLTADIADAELAHASTDKVDLAPIHARIKEADSVRAKVRANEARQNALAAVEGQKVSADALTAKIAALDTAKDTALKAAAFPLPGLSFDETGVVFNRVPFDQVNTAEQLRVSVAIAAAMNPKLRVMLIRHGNDLDEQSFALLGQLATEQGFQVWIERIEGGKGAVVIEDGRAVTVEEAT